jgi:hypothetical protein
MNTFRTTIAGPVAAWGRRLLVAGLLVSVTLSAGTAQAAQVGPTAQSGTATPLVGHQPAANVPTGPTSTSVPTAPTSTSAQPAACNPRPRVTVQSEPALLPASSAIIGPPGVDALLVTVTTTGAGKGVRALRFTSTANAMVSVLDANAYAAPYEVTFPAGNEPGKISFALWRQDPTRASFARLVVVDACGEWTTFVGRGAGQR